MRTQWIPDSSRSYQVRLRPFCDQLRSTSPFCLQILQDRIGMPSCLYHQSQDRQHFHFGIVIHFNTTCIPLEPHLKPQYQPKPHPTHPRRNLQSGTLRCDLRCTSLFHAYPNKLCSPRPRFLWPPELLLCRRRTSVASALSDPHRFAESCPSGLWDVPRHLATSAYR